MAENQTAHTEVPGGGTHEGFPPFQKDSFASQLFWFVLAFALLYVLMAKLGLPRVGSILAARRERIEGDVAAANQLKRQADQAFAAYEKALADARARAQAIAQETRERLSADAERDRKALEDRLNSKLADAEKAIAASRAAAMENVRGIAVETAAAIVARLTGTAPAEKITAQAVDDVLKR
jgi:F-type H+-transporting ATPase subunit b